MLFQGSRLGSACLNAIGFFAFAGLVACGAQSSSTIPGAIASGKAPVERLTIRIVVPKAGRQRRHKPAYISPATQSLSITITPSGGGAAIASEIANLTPTSEGCQSTLTSTICTISAISLPPGKYDAALTAYAGTNGNGTVLSQGEDEPFTIVAGVRNKISLSLYGVPYSYLVTSNSDSVTGTMSSGFTIAGGVWGAARRFQVAAIDASGNLIVGPGSPALSISSTDPSFSIAQPTAQLPNSFSLSTPTTTANETAQLTVSAAFPDATVCELQAAVCNANVAVTYAPFYGDDWVTFAHDQQRTSRETLSTGIDASNVSTLVTRWTRALGGAEWGSPVVYNGNVLVAQTLAHHLYDLSAATGQTLWNVALSGSLVTTPTIDVDDQLVFIGTYSNVINPSTGYYGPSTFYALHLADGSVAWQQSYDGSLRSSSLYVNGVVYEGISGSDSFANCLNGGVVAMNARTGAVLWHWYVNTIENPGGGGAVWGAIAYDGSHIVFGTGNVCGASLAYQGAAALNTDGSMAWSIIADSNTSHDNDTGAGVMVQGGTVSFLNKDGTFYTADETSGATLRAVPLGAISGRGGFSSPGSDGSITVVGAGYFSTASLRSDAEVEMCLIGAWGSVARRRAPKEGTVNGFSSALKAIDSAGNILWSDAMTSGIVNYPAVGNGLVYAGMDGNIDAIDIKSGSILWQYPGANTFLAGPVIVPSGLYGVDNSGNVYALSLPAVAPNGRQHRHRPRGVRA
jgi:outer membrane protein assembly factor BamB